MSVFKIHLSGVDFQACRGDSLPQKVEVIEDQADGSCLSAQKADGPAMPATQRGLDDFPDRVPVFENQLLLWSTTPGCIGICKIYQIFK